MRLHPLAPVLAACLLLARGAIAAPWPSLRPAHEPVTWPALPAGARPAIARPAQDACGTALDQVVPMLSAHVEREPVTPLATTNSADVDGIAVLEDDGTFFYPNKDGNPVMDVAAVARAFYRTHGDDYDQVAFYCASGMPQFIVSPTALAASWMVRNRTQGLGLPLFDVGAALGSPARLQAFLTMNALSRYPADPDESIYGPLDPLSTMDVIAHEFGHEWLAYVWVDSAGTPSHALLGRDWQHWNFFFDSDSSVMGGCDWLASPPDSFRVDGGYGAYGVLDQYLMGLRARSEVDSFFVVDDPTDFDPPGIYTPPTDPLPGLTCRGRATWWTLDDVERENGARVPDAAGSPHAFRVAFGLVVPHGTAPTSVDLARLQVIRTRFPQVFATNTQGRGQIDVTLDSRAGTVSLAHVPLRDVEDGSGPIVVGATASVTGGAMGLRVDPASVRLHLRTSTAVAFSDLAFAQAGPDSFALVLPALPQGTIEYWLTAASDSAGIDAQLPALGPAAPFRFTVGPDHALPVVVHVPVPVQGSERLPQDLLAHVTDNVGVDSVWCEVSVDGGPVTIAPAARAGADSFTVALGAGLGAGHAIAYRFGARDVSAAHNVAYSNAAFDTLRVDHDIVDDFENPARSYAHGPVTWSERDDWHLEALPDSLGIGTAWHCGVAGGPYDPHGDAALVVPAVYGIVSGTTITFDERHVLEQADFANAYDASRLELQAGNGPWQPVEPVPGYTHVTAEDGLPLPAGTACWSGDTHGWVTRTLDLTPWAPGPVRLRLRQVTDELAGFDGTWLDRVHVHYPGGVTSAGAGAPVAFAAGPVGPNPTRGALSLPLSLPRTARVDWALLDVQGRRVATLWSGTLAAGRAALSAGAPASLAPGLYFSCVRIDGATLAVRRVALAR